MKAIKLILSYIFGVFAIPFILLLTPKGSTKLKFLDSIFGNVDDGIDGDISWYPKWIKQQTIISLFPRYWWLAIRNPAHNLGKSMGVNGTIISLSKKGQKGEVGAYSANGFYKHEVTNELEEFSFSYGVHKYPFVPVYIRYVFGPKIWDEIKVGDVVHKNYGITVQPFTTAKNAGV